MCNNLHDLGDEGLIRRNPRVPILDELLNNDSY